MRVLVVGGAASGKSAYAERLAVQLAPVRIYVATMVDDGHEARARIERHRQQRATYGFRTVEMPDLRALSSCVWGAQSDVAQHDNVSDVATNDLEYTRVLGSQTCGWDVRLDAAQRDDAGDLGLDNFGENKVLVSRTCDRDAQPSVMLLEDLGNLVANTLFASDGTMADPTHALDALSTRLDALTSVFDHAVVVGNLVGCEGPYPYAGTQAWTRLVGALCCRLAARFDSVVEVVSGVPCAVKGGDPLCP